MNDKGYITVQGWMRTELDLKGSELLAYAIIYGFSQDGTWFTGSQRYLADWLGVDTRTVRTILAKLSDCGILTKKEVRVNGVKYCYYRASDVPEGDCTALEIQAIESTPKRKVFTPPTADEVNAYCRERGNGIDGQTFCDFYESKGWLVGSSKMKDWKAAVRTWEAKKGFKYVAPQPNDDLTSKYQ